MCSNALKRDNKQKDFWNEDQKKSVFGFGSFFDRSTSFLDTHEAEEVWINK